VSQIGTIRLETQNSATVDIPVFEIGDSGSDVYEFVRVETASGTGFIPVRDPADASYPYLRVQSESHGVVAVHNDVLTETLVDSFEDGNISEYNTTTDKGDATVIQDSSEAIDGDYYLEIFSNFGSSMSVDSNEGDGLPYYPEAGDIIKHNVHPTSTSDEYYFRFGAQGYRDNGETYFVGNLFSSDWQIGYVDSSNNRSTLASYSNFNFDSTDWHTSEIEWKTNGDIISRVYDPSGNEMLEISANDTEWSSGGIGFRLQASATIYVDWVRALN
jgi:hypothetical protein